ncbi:flavin-containing monooxygenase [Allonocardiopsis opalescens]|uniref:Cation diffusion facilitator CzcD-associated flavoprotein CzcO n=1 Tax=Allonocardiopsis opalescens TaxID=1144618 RepID=A0A2T0Q7C8_9ACTN|nr:NAD(P)/FAD-dependent oxidoreductase [Allonocardiopsis opalescens]PRX99749.1 cation diffusion facilitator CzcD-associated flavoprotein CzcO [Allonocardiopsis opalescens]
MTLISPDHPTYVVPPVTDVDEHELAAAIDAAEPGALLMALVHLTGDTGLVAEFKARLDDERRQAETSATMGRYPAGVAAEVRARARRLLGGTLVPRIAVPDDDLFRRMAEVCVDDAVGGEYVPHLREQGGFEAARPVVPRTRTPPEDFTVAVIGAGMIGLNAAVKLGAAGFRYQVFEERDELGGTWSRNTYPGAAVDTPSHFYSYSFELNPRWTRYYPTGPEYLDYLRGVARKYDLYPRISFGAKVLGCAWLDEQRVWQLTVRHRDGAVRTHQANAVVTATGVLNGAFVPAIEGADTFTGTMMHTAEWREDVDLRGKRVVILGTGCTSVQVVADIVEQVESLAVVMRQPHWIVPERQVGEDVPDGMRWALEHIPYFHQWFRLKSYWWAADKGWAIPRIDAEWYATHVSASPANDALMRVCLDYLDRAFADRPDLKAKLTPDFPPFAKRIVKDPGFFDAVKRDKVSLHAASFDRIRPDGVVTTTGEFLPADVIIWATGFKLEYLGFLDITGRDGVRLADEWADQNPRAYLGITVPGFPNLFVTAGPNAAPNHGGGHNVTSEEHVHYIVESLQYLLENGYAAMEPTRAATDDYNRRVDAELDTTVWKHGGTANGYYRNTSGRAWISCPWRLVDYWTMLRAPAPEDYLFFGDGNA